MTKKILEVFTPRQQSQTYMQFLEWLTKKYVVLEKDEYMKNSAACTKKADPLDKEILLEEFYAYLDGENKKTANAPQNRTEEKCKQCGSVLSNTNSHSLLCDECLSKIDTSAFTRWLVICGKIVEFLDNADDIKRISKNLEDLKREKDSGNWQSCPMYSSYTDFMCQISEKIDETEEELQYCLSRDTHTWQQYCKECNVLEESIDKKAEMEQANKFYNEYID